MNAYTPAAGGPGSSGSTMCPQHRRKCASTYPAASGSTGIEREVGEQVANGIVKLAAPEDQAVNVSFRCSFTSTTNIGDEGDRRHGVGTDGHRRQPAPVEAQPRDARTGQARRRAGR